MEQDGWAAGSSARSKRSSRAYAAAPAEMKDVVTSEGLSHVDRAKLEAEIQELSAKMDELWRIRADRREWDEVKADLSVYQFSGQKVETDPRRAEAYRQKVVEGLGFGTDAKEKRPYMSADDLAACREVLARKSGGFWLPRTTVRNVLHDCVPTGPPVSSQPHHLKGESAAWVDEKLEEEVQRGQLVRGSSAWGSPPFPTKEMPSHKRHRKRRLVVDYRRVNARVQRSTYYCRKATDVLATAAGSVYYSFVDAVTGFNQIRNSRRAMEVLAIVARSGKFLPVCLTFGPVNGPDDFCYVVDRAFAPGRNRRMRYTKEWVAYVDDLTVRTGRVLDGRFVKDDEADREIKEACREGPVGVGQTAGDALKELGVDPGDLGKGRGSASKPKHDERVSDHNHPTRRKLFVVVVGCCLSFESPSRHQGFLSSRFQGSFFESFVSFPQLVRAVEPQPFLWLQRPCRAGQGRGAVQLCLSHADRQVADSDRGLADCKVADLMGRRNKQKFWNDLDEMGRAVTRALRHGGHGHKNQLSSGGWIQLEHSARLFGVSRDWLLQAIALDENKPKKRFQLQDGWVRAIQGHSADSGIEDPRHLYEAVSIEGLRSRGLSPWVQVWHGTDLDRVDGIARFGLLAGGGTLVNRLTVHWVMGDQPHRDSAQKGFRTGSSVVIQTALHHLWDAGVEIFHGAEGVILTASAPPETLRRVWEADEKGDYNNLIASYNRQAGVLQLLSSGPSGQVADAGVERLAELPDGDTDESSEEDDQDAKEKGSSAEEVKPTVQEEGALATEAVEAVDRESGTSQEVSKETSEVALQVQNKEASPATEHKEQATPEVASAPLAGPDPKAKVPKATENELFKTGRWDFAKICATLGRYRKAVRQREFEIRKHKLFQKKEAAKLRRQKKAARARVKSEQASQEVPPASEKKQSRDAKKDSERRGDRDRRRRSKKEKSKKDKIPADRGRSRDRRARVAQSSVDVERLGRVMKRACERHRSQPALRLKSKSPEKPRLKSRSPEKSMPEVVQLRPVEHEWGSWVCSECRNVNRPQAELCEFLVPGTVIPCSSNFWESEEWASDLLKEVRREEKMARKERHRTLLSRALELARWNCERCGGQNILTRRKCYQCSAWKPRRRGGSDSSDDSERERRITKALDDVSAAVPTEVKKRKRAGRKRKKKVCRRCKGRHYPKRHHRCQQVSWGLTKEVLAALQSRKRLHLPAKIRNKRAHALNGNGGFEMASMVRYACLLGFIPLALRTEQEAEEVLESVSTYVQRTLTELEDISADAVRTSGLVLQAMILTAGAGILWAIGRIVANRLMRSGHGNSASLPTRLVELKGDESVWEVTGTKQMHRVWMSKGQSACACKGYLSSGVCGHIDAATAAAKAMKLKTTSVTFEGAASSSEGLRSLGGSHAEPEGSRCFAGVVEKAQELFSQRTTEQKEDVGCFGKNIVRSRPTVSKPAARGESLLRAMEEEAAPQGAHSQRSKDAGPSQSREVGHSQRSEDAGSWTGCQAKLLEDSSTFEFLVKELKGCPSQSKIYIRAYSFDQPDLVTGLKACMEKGARVQMISDLSQASGKTKQQLQVLKELQSSGAKIRMIRGLPVNAAYAADRRSVKVGTGLRGLHHAKSTLIVLPDGTAKLEIGSCNYTTSSKANRECSIVIKTSEDESLVRTWVKTFEETFQHGNAIDEVEQSRAGSSNQRPEQQ